MNEVDLFNAFEIGLWLILAAIACWLSLRASERRESTIFAIAALLLIAFSASDAVELKTGAWWRPWWLLCWKGACVVGLLGAAIAYKFKRK